MRDALLRLIISLEDKASAGLRGIQGALGAVAGGAVGAASGFASFLAGAAQVAVGGLIQRGIEGIAASIGLLKDGMIGGNAEFERYGVQFGVLLGNAEAAEQRLADLAQFGATTPFELPEVVRADKILQGFGLHAEEAAQRFGYAGADIRRIAGDTAAGTGASFEEIAGYIGKFASGATGETIARFQELGIVTKQQLTEMGLAFDKGGSLIINSQEDLDRATGILVKAMDEKFGGMMQAQSATFEGMISNLQDWKGATLRIIGEPIFDVLKVHLQDLLAWLPSTQPQIEAFAQSLARGIGASIVWIKDSAIPGMRTGWDWLTGTGLPAAQAGFDAVAMAINTARTGWDWLTGTGLPAAQAGFAATAQTIEGGLRAGLDWLAGTALPTLQAGWAQVQPLIATAGESLAGITPLFEPLRAAVQPVVDAFGEGGLRGALAALPGAIPGALGALSDLRTELTALALEGLGGLLTKLSDLPALSEGLRTLGASEGQIAAVTGTLRTLGEILATVAGWVRQTGQWFMDDLLPPVAEAGRAFAEMLAPHLSWLADFVGGRLMPILGWFGQVIGDNLPGAIRVIAPLVTGLVDMGLSALELALMGIVTTWETYLRPVFEIWGGWLEDLTGGWDNLARGAERVKETMTLVAEGLRAIAEGRIDFSQVFAGMQGLFPGLQIPGFAGGVTNFGGGLAIVGERGPELVRLPGGADVIPAGRFGAAGGGGDTNVYLTVQGSVVRERDLVEAVRRGLISTAQRNNGSGVT